MAERSNLSRTRVLVTGGAGFIGSNFVHRLLAKHAVAQVVVLDALTYAGRRENLHGLPRERLTFIHGDIRNPVDVRNAMEGCEFAVNFAAGSPLGFAPVLAAWCAVAVLPISILVVIAQRKLAQRAVAGGGRNGRCLQVHRPGASLALDQRTPQSGGTRADGVSGSRCTFRYSTIARRSSGRRAGPMTPYCAPAPAPA